MCWVNKEIRVSFAETDVPVFKIAKVKEYTGKVYSYFQGTEYRENTIHDCDTISFFFRHTIDGNYMVDKGIHSYSLDNLRLNAVKGSTSFRVTTYKTTLLSPDVIAQPQWYNSRNCVIMLCVIPKGTRYAVNSVGEIVSDSIEVVKMLIESFSFNKDALVSVRSVDRVNKILDDWKKHKYNNITL